MDQGNLEILFFLLKEKNREQSFLKNFQYTA